MKYIAGTASGDLVNFNVWAYEKFKENGQHHYGAAVVCFCM
ncbi:hypothetical protein [Niabella drilacis]|uniref:Uncharacterized protein n=1 Tax=Niabella drilacis (strain DSM 25811 / CCM 8410 / CCUG 62505 / LMG 26954 / E90) TaxID=1285928 RepID=A0A1G6IA51_NIADE|nr:hypothetical protein [Niabella drilacis]SDC02885.1 hypothetical protein SAMN04487894_101137 [Niabella drilacis]